MHYNLGKERWTTPPQVGLASRGVSQYDAFLQVSEHCSITTPYLDFLQAGSPCMCLRRDRGRTQDLGTLSWYSACCSP